MKTAAQRIRPLTWLVCAAVLTLAVLLAVSIGAVHIPLGEVVRSLASRLHIMGATPSMTSNDTIIWELRLPRVILAALVGAMLATAGCAYQGTLRNPLADPYLLGVSAGAGLGATINIVFTENNFRQALPLCAFVGALFAVTLTYRLGRSGIAGRSSASLVLAGVAIANLLTALQTLVQQRSSDKLREVYAWALGQLNTTGWADVRLIAPYVLICIAVLIRYRRVLDVFAVGDEEAQTMGLPVGRARAAVVIAASLGTAAAVSVTGLIGFVGIIVPHTLRILIGTSYRVLIPLSAICGGAFLVAADLLSRTALAPEEIPIGVITAALGAPFFLVVMRSKRQG